MELFVSFAALLFAATAIHVAGQPGFLSIDCGLEAEFSPRKDDDTGIVYVSDGPYVDGGENHKVASGYDNWGTSNQHYHTLRSFPSGLRNCYTLPTESGAKYLLRLQFYHGDYDGKISSSVQFDLHLGTNYWETCKNVTYWWSEAIFVAWASSVPVCLVNTGGGTPFVNSVLLRKLDATLYPQVNADRSMAMYKRANMGSSATSVIRFPDDPYDRFWFSSTSSLWTNISTRRTIRSGNNFAVPLSILQTAVAAIDNGTNLNIMTNPEASSFQPMVFLHFADFQNSQLRQFDIHVNDDELYQYALNYLTASNVYTSGRYKATGGKYHNITLVPTNISELPPMINAYEIYGLITHNTSRTFPRDVEVIMAIKLEYGVMKNWMGDPCFPVKYAWDGVNCSSNTTGSTARITSLDLSNSTLHGVISDNFSMLTELEYLDLSGNRLSGPIPDSLCKNNGGSLILRYDSDENTCNKTISLSPSRNRAAIISISVVVPVVVVAVLILSYVIWRGKKPKISKHDPPREPELPNVRGSRKCQGDPLPNIENRQFTYKELEKFTNKFGRFIGQGGFGLVYYGRLEDNTEVAVKMRSESSSHGLDEFLAEVQSLTKVHHSNLVSLVGYCCEKDHLALVYEYMSRGNLCDHLRGKGGDETFNWGHVYELCLMLHKAWIICTRDAACQ